MNWEKWIIERLPRRLRVVGMFALCVVLTSYIRRLYEDFVEWRRRQRIRMSGTPQVCQLRKIVYDELGVDIIIKEGNGKPIDFIIQTSFVDIDKERRLFALLDRYKLAGKSYGYENADIVLETMWSGYLCERGEQSVTWGGFMCERGERSVAWSGFTCERAETSAPWSSFVCERLDRITTCDIAVRQVGNYCYAKAEFPPESTIVVYFEATAANEDTGQIIKYEERCVINKGVDTEQSVFWPHDVEAMTAYLDLSVDDKYNYRIIWR